jgi:predicted dehydrogenase
MATQRWAAIGTGTISRSVVPDLQRCDGAEVAVVESRDAAKAAQFAQEFGIPQSTNDFDEVQADDAIDAIYLATPFATHHAMARSALAAGKHVLVEKPMAMNSAEVADLFEAAREHGRFVMEAMWMKFSPVFRRLHGEIDKGTIGSPRNVRATFSIPFPGEDNSSKWDITRSGGALLGWLTLTPPFWTTTDLEIHAGGMAHPVEFPREGSGYVPRLKAVIKTIAMGEIEDPVHTASDTLAVFNTIDQIFAQLRKSTP